MAITLEINGEDKSASVLFGTVKKKDNINQRTDTLDFTIPHPNDLDFLPEVNDTVTLFDGSTKEFSGNIITVQKSLVSRDRVLFKCKAKDEGFELDRLLVVEGYEDTDVETVIKDIIDNYAPSFTYVNVSCTLEVKKIIFDRLTVSEAIEKLSQYTGFSWYIDYDKDIHFFEKNTEEAPFTVSGENGNLIQNTLKITDDLSQIRNIVFIKGGEIEGAARTEIYDGDGTKVFFRTANKFARLPTVIVGGVPQTVGVDFLDDEASFDCFWDFDQKYIRFKIGSEPPTGTDNVEVSGIPLFNLVVQVEEPDSIATYGKFEYALIDKSLRSREQAVSFGKAQLQSYANKLNEGSFSTYTSGLRSGQIITVDSIILAQSFNPTSVVLTDFLSVSSEDTNPQGIAFNNDGSKMFISGNQDNRIYEYVLPTPFDISIAIFSQSFDVSNEDTAPKDLAFNDNGSKMYMVGNDTNSVHQYDLPTPFDISTASFEELHVIDLEDESPQGIAFNDNGSKMYIAGNQNDSVHEYTLSTNFKVSTAFFTNSFSVATQDNQIRDVDFNTDGSKMFVLGSQNDLVYEYELNTEFDISTTTFLQSFSLPDIASPQGIVFSADGEKLFVVDNDNVLNRVNEYAVSSEENTTEKYLIQSVEMSQVTTERNVYRVKLVTLRTIGIIQFLIDLLKAGDVLVEEVGDSVLEKTIFPNEQILIGETINIDTDHVSIPETVEISESFTVQPLDYDVEFVVGPQTPSGTKRQFILDGSRLA